MVLLQSGQRIALTLYMGEQDFALVSFFLVFLLLISGRALHYSGILIIIYDYRIEIKLILI